jgi:hypothetical protein
MSGMGVATMSEGSLAVDEAGAPWKRRFFVA